MYNSAVKNTLKKLAHYNRMANGKLLDVLETLSREQLTRTAGSYFGSVLGLLNHILKSDIGWLQRLHAEAPGVKTLHSPLLELPRALAFDENLFDELEPLKNRRFDIDEIFESFVAEVDDDYLTRNATFVNRQGKEQVLRPGDVLLHLFNHQTHHRGAISQILDSMSVENDFSSLISTLID